MKVEKYYKMLKRKKIANIIISLTAIASILILLFTFYGNQVGNFVVSVEEQNRYTISLSENYSFEKSFSRLSAEGLKGTGEYTYGYLPSKEEITSVDGTNNDKDGNYLAYTFYLRNESSKIIDYDMTLTIQKVTNRVDSAIRVMIYKNNEAERIYAKWRELPEDEKYFGLPEELKGEYDYFGQKIVKEYTTIKFLSEVTIAQEKFVGLTPKAIDKYTVIIWLEGADPQCTSNKDFDIMGGTLKMDMKFSVQE